MRGFFPVRIPEAWLFPVGCYNSGTTVTQTLLAAHPDIATMPKEGVRFTSFLPSPEDKGWTQMWVRCQEYMNMGSEVDPDRAARIQRDWAPWLNSSRRVFMDKSVSNLTRMKWLDRNFGNAYFVGIVRDGYCVAEGIRRRARPRAAPARQVGTVYPIEMCGEQWVTANERLLSAADAVKHFMLIRYEDLINSPVATLREIWKFAGLNAPPMNAVSNGILIGSKAFPIARGNNERSHARLSDDDVRRLTPIVHDMQARLGYPLRG
jgi:hypothetical protein